MIFAWEFTFRAVGYGATKAEALADAAYGLGRSLAEGDVGEPKSCQIEFERMEEQEPGKEEDLL